LAAAATNVKIVDQNLVSKFNDCNDLSEKPPTFIYHYSLALGEICAAAMIK
jgi:hypothetical protein